MGACLEFLGRGRLDSDAPPWEAATGRESTERGEGKPRHGPVLPWWWHKVKGLECRAYRGTYEDEVRRGRIILDFSKARRRELEEGATEEIRRTTDRQFERLRDQHEDEIRKRKGPARRVIPDEELQLLEALSEPGPSVRHLEEVD